jgi:hypothetical protein
MSEARPTPPSSRIPLSGHQSSPDTTPTFRNPMSTPQRPRDRAITAIPSMTPRTLSPTPTTSRSGLATQARRRNAQCPIGERLRTRSCMERPSRLTKKPSSSSVSTTSSPSPSEKAARGAKVPAWLASPSRLWISPVDVPDSQSSDYSLTLDEELLSGEGSAAGTPPPMAGERQG